MSDNSDYESSDNITTDESSLTQGFSDYERSSYYKELSEDDKTLYRKILSYIQKLSLNDNIIDIYQLIDKFNNIKNDLKQFIQKSKKPELNNISNSLDDDAILFMIIMYSAILNNADVSFVYEDEDGETGLDKYISLLQEIIVSNEILRKNSIFSMNNAYAVFNIKPLQSEKISPIRRILRNCDLVLRTKNDFGYSNINFPLTSNNDVQSLIAPKGASKNIPVISMNEKYVNQSETTDSEFTEEQIKEKIQKARDENKKDVQKHWEDVLTKQKSKKDKAKKTITYFSYDKPVSNIDELIEYYIDNVQKFAKTNESINDLKNNLLNIHDKSLSNEIIEVQKKFKDDYLLIYTQKYIDENNIKVKNINKTITSWTDNIPKGINKLAIKEYRKWYNNYFNPIAQDKQDIEWYQAIIKSDPIINEDVFDKKFKTLVDIAYKKYVARKKDEERREKMKAFRESSKFKVSTTEDSDDKISDKLKKIIKKTNNEETSDSETETSSISTNDLISKSSSSSSEPTSKKPEPSETVKTNVTETEPEQSTKKPEETVVTESEQSTKKPEETAVTEVSETVKSIITEPEVSDVVTEPVKTVMSVSDVAESTKTKSKRVSKSKKSDTESDVVESKSTKGKRVSKSKQSDTESDVSESKSTKGKRVSKSKQSESKKPDEDLSEFFKQMSIIDKTNNLSTEFFSKDCNGKGGFKVKELQEMCRQLKLKVSGTKEELCERIKKHFSISDNSSENNSSDNTTTSDDMTSDNTTSSEDSSIKKTKTSKKSSRKSKN